MSVTLDDLWKKFGELVTDETTYQPYDHLINCDMDVIKALQEVDDEHFTELFFLCYVLKNPLELKFYRKFIELWAGFRGD